MKNTYLADVLLDNVWQEDEECYTHYADHDRDEKRHGGHDVPSLEVEPLLLRFAHSGGC